MEYDYAFTDDFQQWQAFKAGSVAAFEYIYDRHFSGMYGYGTRLCPDKDLVKDAIQGLFAELWRNRATLGDVRSIKHYLYKSLRRRIIRDAVQERRYYSTEEGGDNYFFEVSLSHEWLLITEQVTEANLAKLHKAFRLLTTRQQEAIFLRFYENLDYVAIAEVMTLKEVKYARTLIYRALDVLRASIRKLAFA